MDRNSTRARLVAQGLCVDCHKPHKTGKRRCDRCGKRNSANASGSVDCVIQAAFDAMQKQAREARIRAVAADNPRLTFAELAERFGERVDYISGLLPAGEGLRRERESWLTREEARRVNDNLDSFQFLYGRMGKT